jgi:hypothetical protein
MIVLNAVHRSSSALRASSLVVLASAMLVLHACGDANISQPQSPSSDCVAPSSDDAPSLPFRYYLALADGASLPLPLANHTIVLDSGLVELNADSTFSIVQLFRDPGTGPHGPIASSSTTSGSFSRCGELISFHVQNVSGVSFQASALPHLLELHVPRSFLQGASAQGTAVLVYAENPLSYSCGSETEVPADALGAFTLVTSDGHELPHTLDDTYPNTITIAAGSAAITTSAYEIEARGTVSAIDSTVVVAADSGVVAPCQGALKFTSAVRDTSFLVQLPDLQLHVNVSPDFFGYSYNYLGGDDPVTLIFQPNP